MDTSILDQEHSLGKREFTMVTDLPGYFSQNLQKSLRGFDSSRPKFDVMGEGVAPSATPASNPPLVGCRP